MAIWRYDALSRIPSTAPFFARHCIFCGASLSLYSDASGSLQELPAEPPGWRSGERVETTGVTTYTTCKMCGWWTMLHTEEMESRRGMMAVHRGAVGALKDVDSVDIQLPLAEVQQYLHARWEDRSALDWRLVEEIVADVFRTLGFESRVTSRSGDGGIDAILTDSANNVIGVQVKRYRDKISAEQIRAFLGALVNHDMTEGIFVTTSAFQPGASEEASLAASRGYLIELVDAEAFYDAIGIARLEQHEFRPEQLPSVYDTRRLWRTPIN